MQDEIVSVKSENIIMMNFKILFACYEENFNPFDFN